MCEVQSAARAVFHERRRHDPGSMPMQNDEHRQTVFVKGSCAKKLVQILEYPL